MKYAFVLVLMISSIASPASSQIFTAEEAQSSVTVLVDLSGTWLNAASTARDTKELADVGEAIIALAGDDEAQDAGAMPPIEIRYLSIGDMSLGRLPLCQVQYAPRLLPSAKPPSGVIQSVTRLRDFLEVECPRFITTQRPELYTDISGAFDTVARATKEQPGKFRAIIVLSDLQEELRRHQYGEIGRLDGARTLLLYRILKEDRLDPRIVDARLATWTHRLSAVGSSVQTLEDSSAEPGKIERLLLK